MLCRSHMKQIHVANIVCHFCQLPTSAFLHSLPDTMALLKCASCDVTKGGCMAMPLLVLLAAWWQRALCGRLFLVFLQQVDQLKVVAANKGLNSKRAFYFFFFFLESYWVSTYQVQGAVSLESGIRKIYISNAGQCGTFAKTLHYQGKFLLHLKRHTPKKWDIWCQQKYFIGGIHPDITFYCV